MAAAAASGIQMPAGADDPDDGQTTQTFGLTDSASLSGISPIKDEDMAVTNKRRTVGAGRSASASAGGRSGRQTSASRRPPSPLSPWEPATRCVHRRVERAAETLEEKVQKMVEQQELDRECVAALMESLQRVSDRVVIHDGRIEKLQPWQATLENGVEAKLITEMSRLETKLNVDHATALDVTKKSLQDDVQRLNETVRKEFQYHLKEHLVRAPGHRDPGPGDPSIIAMATDGLFDIKLEALKTSIDELTKHTEDTFQKNQKIIAYLGNLEQELPRECQTVVQLFNSLQADILQVRAQMAQ